MSWNLRRLEWKAPISFILREFHAGLILISFLFVISLPRYRTTFELTCLKILFTDGFRGIGKSVPKRKMFKLLAELAFSEATRLTTMLKKILVTC